MELHFVTCDIKIALATTFWAFDRSGPMSHNICHESRPIGSIPELAIKSIKYNILKFFLTP